MLAAGSPAGQDMGQNALDLSGVNVEAAFVPHDEMGGGHLPLEGPLSLVPLFDFLQTPTPGLQALALRRR